MRHKPFEKFNTPWDSMRETYNKQYGTSYKTIQGWLRFLYKKYDGDKTKIAMILGVSISTVRNALITAKVIPHQPTIKKRFLAFPKHKLSNMTREEIMNEFDMSYTYFNDLMRFTDRTFKKQR